MEESDEIPESVASTVSQIDSMTAEERALVVLHLFPVVLGQSDLIDLCRHWIHAVGEVEELKEILESLPVLSELDAARVLSAGPVDPAALARSVESGALIEFAVNGEKIYPAFQFDLVGRSVIPVVRFVNRTLRAAHSPTDSARWWSTPTAFHGRTPLELLDASLLDRSTAEWALGLKDPGDSHPSGSASGAELDGMESGFAM